MKSCSPYVQLLREQGIKVGPTLRNTICYFDGNTPVVCCPSFNNQEVSSPAPPPTKPSQFEPSVTPSTFGDGFDYQNCGFSNAQHNRVVGGVPAVLGVYRWMPEFAFY